MADEGEPVLGSSSNDDSDADSDNGSDGSERVETLVAGRAKRATAGNRMANLIEREEDDEVALLFAEAEGEEDVEFEAGGVDDGSDAEMDSSSDDDDRGPDAAGDDDLEGENELKRQEKAERTKKRKAQEALTNPAAIRKKVKIDPSLPVKSGAPAARPKKKSERASWLPETADAPVRASSRKQTMANKEVTHARLKDNEIKRQKLLAQMKRAERDREAKKPKQLTQADRLAEAEKVEKRNAKSLNRWEAMEKKRAEERQAKLDALQNRKLEGPVFTWWSGKATWTGEKLAMVGSREVKVQPLKEYTGEKRGRKKKIVDLDQNVPDSTKGTPDQPSRQTPVGDGGLATNDTSTLIPLAPIDQNTSGSMSLVKSEPMEAIGKSTTNRSEVLQGATTLDLPEVQSDKVEPSAGTSEPTLPSSSFLEGIHEYASMPPEQAGILPPLPVTVIQQPTEAKQVDLVTKAATDNIANVASATDKSAPIPSGPLPDNAVKDRSSTLDLPQTALFKPNGSSEAYGTAAHQVPALLPGCQVSNPLVTELPFNEPQALSSATLSNPEGEPVPEGPAEPPTYSTRNLLILTDFDNVNPSSFPLLTALTKASRAEKNTTKSTAKAAKQAAATELCPITSKPARFRDPETGIAYADSYAYKRIQDAKNGAFVWSEMLGCYVGREGEVAKGVPKGFLKDEPRTAAVAKSSGAPVSVPVTTDGAKVS